MESVLDKDLAAMFTYMDEQMNEVTGSIDRVADAAENKPDPSWEVTVKPAKAHREGT